MDLKDVECSKFHKKKGIMPTNVLKQRWEGIIKVRQFEEVSIEKSIRKIRF